MDKIPVVSSAPSAVSIGRQVWADFARVVAVYGVVLIHSCGAAFYQYSKIPLSSWLQAVVLDSVVRSAVPLFVMLSGALIFGTAAKGGTIVETIHQIPRRLMRVFVPLVIWSGLYLLYLAQSGLEVDIKSILIKPAMYHLWFGYMILGIYFLLPILRPIYTSMQGSVSFASYFFVVWIVLTSVSVYWPISFLSLLQQNSLFGYGGYFILGALLATVQIPFSSIVWAVVWGASVLLTACITWLKSESAGLPVETAFDYFSPNVVVASVAAFVLLSRIRIANHLTDFIKALSDLSFIVYFVHVLVLEYVRFNPILIQETEKWPVGLLIIAISLITFLLSMLIASTIRLAPGSRHVFG
ncbi:acyltransferase [Thauera humireducens]|uniref:acyltransferase n=1 Tax=Thauera humireducens TaxID=1134435 RepID=UPI0009EE337E|nr:acyltransferase family protein [Thauera humireducens]